MQVAVTNSQGETQSKLQTALDELASKMGAVIESLSAQVQSAADASRRHQDELADHSTRMVGEFGGQVENVVAGVNNAVAEMKAAVDAMRSTTSDALLKMNSGADTLAVAADDFAKAGQGVSSTLDKSSAVANQLSQAAGAVASASQGLGGMLGDYKGARDAISELVHSLQILVEQARKEASMSGDVLARIDGATAKLVEAQEEADSYLERVSEVIGEAHGAFNEGMKKALGDANREFHRQLSDSVKLLRQGIQELEATFASLPTH
jgi:ABC-type transporter Mla subunit MlaD